MANKKFPFEINEEFSGIYNFHYNNQNYYHYYKHSKCICTTSEIEIIDNVKSLKQAKEIILKRNDKLPKKENKKNYCLIS